MHIFDPIQWQVVGKYHFAETTQNTRINCLRLCPASLFDIIYTNENKFYFVHTGNFFPRKIKEVKGASLMIANDAKVSSNIYFGHPDG